MLEQHRSLCRKFIALCDEADLLDEMRILIRLMSLAFVIARKLPEVSKPDYEQLVAITGSFDIAVSSQAKILSLVSVPHFLARYQPKSLCPESESSATNLIPLLK
jgi:hypothetical protein